jgi:hypothetical protein
MEMMKQTDRKEGARNSSVMLSGLAKADTLSRRGSVVPRVKETRILTHLKTIVISRGETLFRKLD